jgi:hypothetical protein
MFCRSLFVLLHFFFWPLCCLFFFDIRILITPLVSSNSSYTEDDIIKVTNFLIDTIFVVFGEMMLQHILFVTGVDPIVQSMHHYSYITITFFPHP